MAAITQELVSGWEFKDSSDSSNEAWLPVAKVPTVVHLDLVDNGRIPDPFIDMNELAVRWVADKSWTYRTTFKPAPDAHADSRTSLVFKGLDTYATVTLNGHVILESDNMFVEYRVDITDKLGPHNELEIVFASAYLRGYELLRENEDKHKFLTRTTDKGRLPVRKCQCHWGWDWGPILITAGPWRPVLLETYTHRVDDVWFEAELSDDLKVVRGKLFARTDVGSNARSIDATVKFSLLLNGETTFEAAASIDDDSVASVDFELRDPLLWFPHGYGDQTRYELGASLAIDQSIHSSLTKHVGFRKIQLIQEEDAFGKSFYFRVNNIDVFAGGSCWIPADSFLPRIGGDKYRKWMELLVQGNQIMIRIWGGGIYEDEAFFDACDELGILVWQDFAFAGASYPAYASFLAQVETEVRYNVRRLRTHPSVAIWIGNNEDYTIQESFNLDYDYDGDKNPESWLRGSFPARYIYEHHLPKILEQESPGALYHPGSPWGDGKKCSDQTVGDTHQWGVWHGVMRRYQELPTMGSRFVSEFGMEAYPHLSTLHSAITDQAQLYPGSMVMDYHNRAGDHERRVLTYVGENFRIKYDLPSFTHLTQVTQANVMDMAYSSWRRDWGKPGSRQTGGILVWQLNDCWPTMSWAIADHYVVPKPAFYAIKRSLKSIAVGVARPFHNWTGGHHDPTVAARDTTYDVWVSSSATDSTQGEMVVRFISVKTGSDLAAPVREIVDVQANSTTDVIIKGKANVNVPSGHDEFDPYVVSASLIIGGELVSTHAAWPHPIKYLDLSDRGVEVNMGDGRIVVTAKKPVHGFVFEEKRDWIKFSDNGFDVIPGEERVVEISGPKITKDDLGWTFVGA